MRININHVRPPLCHHSRLGPNLLAMKSPVARRWTMWVSAGIFIVSAVGYDGNRWFHEVEVAGTSARRFFMVGTVLALASLHFHRKTIWRSSASLTAAGRMAMGRELRGSRAYLLGAQPRVGGIRSTCAPSSDLDSATLFVVTHGCRLWLYLHKRYWSVSLAEYDV